MNDTEFNKKFEKFLLENSFTKEDLAGMYVLCNEREQNLKAENEALKNILIMKDNAINIQVEKNQRLREDLRVILFELDQNNKSMDTYMQRVDKALERAKQALEGGEA